MKQRIAGNLGGAWCLMQFRDSGFARIEPTWAGAQFSFIAALLSLPVFLTLQWLDAGTLDAAALTVTLSIYALQWCLLPLVAYYLCAQWQRLDAYPLFLASYNWMTVWQSLAYAVMLLGLVTGILPQSVMALLSTLLLVYLFAVEGFIAQRALRIGIMGAVGIVILDLFVVWQLGQIRAYLLQS